MRCDCVIRRSMLPQVSGSRPSKPFYFSCQILHEADLAIVSIQVSAFVKKEGRDLAIRGSCEALNKKHGKDKSCT